jgi:hypothetical protein
MDSAYPWSILGIAPTVDEKAIRKAYALKLRDSRPDENPAGFQALREARDCALQERFYLDEAGNDDENERATASTDASSLRPAPVSAPPVSTIAHASASQRDAESIIVINAPELSADGEDSINVEDLLDEVGRQHPWRDLASRWAAVFDALEHAPFDEYFHSMHLVLGRLVDDLRRQAADTPDPMPGHTGLAEKTRQLGPYADVLADLEARFQFLRQDRILFDYLDDDEAEELIEALTLAVGRTAVQQAQFRPAVNVEDIDLAYVDAAFNDEPKMRAYCIQSRKDDQFGWSFSVLALLFPLPMALYYRLRGLAILIGALMFVHALTVTVPGAGDLRPYRQISQMIYIVVAVAFALQSRRLRVQALVAQVKSLTGEGHDYDAIRERLGGWGKPSGVWLCAGIAIAVFFLAVRIYVQYGRS